ncbi:MAG: PTS sugar transporter subunit IIA [Gammaproteobacteria bacterium]|jgi:PTS system nitrogen regulatory IIA component
MNIGDLLSSERVCYDLNANSKKAALEALSKLLADDDSSAIEIFDGLIGRERLGNTGLGKGIAIPHARIASAKHLKAALIKLAQPIDYDAADHVPVDMLFCMLVPEEASQEYLNVIAAIASLFSDAEAVEHLRSAGTAEAMLNQVASRKVSDAA